MTDTIPTDALKAARKDPRIVKITVYADGWVPNSYRWPTLGSSHSYRRPPEGDKPRRWTHGLGGYDRKRSHGMGPHWVAFSDRGGRLASA